MDHRRLSAIIAGLLLVAGAVLAPAAGAEPGIAILSTPADGSDRSWISGEAPGADPAAFAVVVYIRVDRAWWGPKPAFAAPITAIRPDGFWIAEVVTGGRDAEADRYAAYLVPQGGVQLGVMPPELRGAPDLPPSLEAYPHAVANRSSRKPLSPPAVAREGTDLVGLDFGPYVDGERPGATVLSEATIRQRLGVVAPNTTWVRTFGTDGGLEHVGPIAHSLGKKAAIGTWLDADLAANRARLEALAAIGRAGDADLLVAGSETLERGELSDRALATYLEWVRGQVPGVPVTTADTYTKLLGAPSVVEASDLVFVNIYPYWEGVPVGGAVSRTREAYLAVSAAAQGRPVVISEMGWPDGGEARGGAVPNETNAARYLHEATAWAHAAGVPYFYFAAFDEAWKAGSEGEVGAHWGLWTGGLEPKPGRLPLPRALLPVPPSTLVPTDTDNDGVYDDVNGNGRQDFADVVLYFNNMGWIAVNEPVSAFDYNGNGRIDFADVVWLFTAL